MRKGSLAFLVGLFFLNSAHAAGVDTTFGTNGRTVLDLGGISLWAQSAILQSDGKIVVVGYTPGLDSTSPVLNSSRDFLVARFNANGVLDSSFSGDGVATIDFAGNEDRGYAVTQQSDGKLIVAGYTVSSRGDSDIAIARLLSDGTLDSSFQSAGKGTINFPCTVTLPLGAGFIVAVVDYGEDRAYKLTLQPDGKLLLGGAACSDTSPSSAMVRLLNGGNPDSTYGTGGLQFFSNPNQGRPVGAMLLEADGRVFASSGLVNAQVAADGSSVQAYGVLAPTGLFISSPNAVVLQSNGKYLLAGLGIDLTTGDRKSLITRLESTLTPDVSYGNAGYALGTFGSYESRATSMVSEPAGKILVGGHVARGSGHGTLQDAAVYRLATDGSPDSTFGTNGSIVVDFSEGSTAYSSYTAELLRAGDGKLILVANRGTLAGDISRSFQVASQRIVLARLTSTPEFSFTQSSVTTSESATNVTITVTRTGTTNNPVSVSYSTTAGTASATSDFASAGGTLTWASSDADSKTFNVSLTNDATSESNENFSVQLSNPSEGSLGTATTTVTITDDDVQPSQGSGGGGGATEIFTLISLLLLGFGRGRVPNMGRAGA